MDKTITVQIKENTRRELNKLKYELNLKTIDNVIKVLILNLMEKKK